MEEQIHIEQQEPVSYPSMRQAWGIVAFVIICSVVWSPINFVSDKIIPSDLSMLLYYSLTMGSALFVIVRLRNRYEAQSGFSVQPVSLLIWPLLIVGTIALQLGVSLPISSSIPMPEAFKEMFDQLIGETGFLTFLTLAVAAPVFEELIFRGVILDGLLKRYSVATSIMMSSFFFGIVHLNPWQLVSAFIMGCFIGWVYYRSRNIWLCIFIHFVNNGFAFLVMALGDEESLADDTLLDMYGGWLPMIGAILGGILLFGAALFALNQIFNRDTEPGIPE